VFIRNFYGVVRVLRIGPIMLMDNLKTLHGFVDERTPRAPLTYYSPNSGIGRALHSKMTMKPSLKVGVIGLGVGSVACYDRPGDAYSFFEINPTVSDLAGPTSRTFRNLRGAPAPVELVEGDGRLILERELEEGHPRQFDLLAVDAFTGDSVPWHLLTIEAIRLYFGHLAPDGILAIHVTNPLPVDRLAILSARELGLYGVYIVDVPTPGALPSQWHSKSRYVLLAKAPEVLSDPVIQEGALVGFGPKVFRGESRDSWKLAFLKRDTAWTDSRSSSWDLIYKRSVLDELKDLGIRPVPVSRVAPSTSPSLLPRALSR
ncbi:MAG TPA: hypothetical protein VJ483_03550, partial [Holophagaceae bacterium]|nr:hypothetical protein [Holophagaceae bacterium]